MPANAVSRVWPEPERESPEVTHFPKVGDQFGAFLITGEIGHGGMGVVFSAVQQPLNRPVALKVLDPRFTNDPEFIARFTREGEVLARMNSPHVIQVFEHGRVGDCLYLAMQQVTGGDLADYLQRNGPLPPALAADLAAQVASALADAHAQGIIHRDIKPSNILLAKTGADLFAYLCDFGIAQSASQGVTRTGMLAGSLAFTAPERHEGRPADVRSDLYSLGCLLWCLLRGANPYAGTDFQVAQQHFTAPVPQVSGSGPVEVATNQVLASLMAKDPDQRPASAVEAVSALQALKRVAETHGDLTNTSTRLAPRVERPFVPGAAVGGLTPATTVARAHPQQASRPDTPAPPPGPTPQQKKPGSPGRTALIAAAIVVATALVGSGGLWAFSTLVTSQPVTTAVTSSPAVTAPEETEEPSDTTEPTRGTVRDALDEVAVGRHPHGVAVNPGSRLAFVANYDDASVSVFNLDTNSVTRKIDVGKNPQSIVVDSASGLLLVGCDGVPAVQLYELQGYRLVGSVSTGKGPIRLAVHSGQKVAYAVAQGSSTMGVISLSSYKLIQTVKVGAQPRVIGVDERDQIAYIGHWNNNTVSVVDLNSQSKIADLKVGKDPNGIVLAPDARLGFVASYGNGKDGGGSVTVIDLDTRAVKKRINVDAGPSRLAVDEDAGAVYLTCLYARKINVISLSAPAVIDRFSTVRRPTGAAVDSSTGKLYVSSFDENVVQVFGA